MKDLYDIWLLSRQFNFDGNILAQAVPKTFTTRRTRIPTDPVSFHQLLRNTKRRSPSGERSSARSGDGATAAFSAQLYIEALKGKSY